VRRACSHQPRQPPVSNGLGLLCPANSVLVPDMYKLSTMPPACGPLLHASNFTTTLHCAALHCSALLCSALPCALKLHPALAVISVTRSSRHRNVHLTGPTGGSQGKLSLLSRNCSSLSQPSRCPQPSSRNSTTSKLCDTKPETTATANCTTPISQRPSPSFQNMNTSAH
jgi:hypothetical protein